MSYTIASYIVGVLTLGIYCLLVLPTVGWRRVAAPLILIVLYADILWCGVQALGHPKPTWATLPSAEEAQLIAYQFDEPHAIYLWLRVPWTSEPIAYSIPWQEQQAKQLQETAQRGAADGTPIVVKRRSKWAAGDVMAYPAPVAPLPDKGGT